MLSVCVLGAAFTSCTKSNSNTQPVDEGQVLNDFVQKTALPQYADLQAKATIFNNAVTALNTNATDTNMATARQAWKDTRQAWEQCEGYLFGPVEDNNYDPDMDTWPVDHGQLDSVMASSNALQLADIRKFPLALRGFHPIEYILWGTGGTSTAASITPREKLYMVSLAADILAITANLNASWLPTGGNYRQDVLLAGKGSTVFKTRKDAFLAIAGAITHICDEVGSGKMSDPFIAKDSTTSESPFSHNSLIDFRNNIVGAQNVYLCSYQSTAGQSLSGLVAMHNLQLDNTIRGHFASALATLNNITGTYEQAIYTQPTQVQNAITALATLQSILDSDLKTYIQQYVTD
jgi:putative iron-regulated protein